MNIDIKTIKCIERFKKVHGDRYIYKDFIYITAKENSIIHCRIHGSFEQSPYRHYNGSGCNKCLGKGLSREEHIENFKHIHGDKYRYDNFEYNGNHEHSKITCKLHNDFDVTPANFKRGRGCPKCSGKKLNNNEHIKEFIIVHKDRYDYSKFVYNGPHIPSIITCKLHNDFLQTPVNHRGGQGCPICKIPHSEREIYNYLSDNNIIFETQKRFDKCKYKRKLPFDFYLPMYNLCIEYDGRQHFEPVKFGGSDKSLKNFNNTQRNDTIKNKFCIDNNIRLLRISCYDNNNIINILEKQLKMK